MRIDDASSYFTRLRRGTKNLSRGVGSSYLMRVRNGFSLEPRAKSPGALWSQNRRPRSGVE